MHLAFLHPVPQPAGTFQDDPTARPEFFRALFRYAPFDGYLFFTPQLESADSQLEAVVEHWGTMAEIEPHHLLDLPEVLAETPIQALHGLGSHLHPLAYARHLVPGASFPVTASATAPLGFAWEMAAYGQDATCGLQTGDTVICADAGTQEVLNVFYAEVAERQRAAGHGQGRRPELTVIPPGVDTERCHPQAKAGWRQRLNLPADAFVAISLAPFSARTQVDLPPALRALFHFLKADVPGRPPVYWVLAGTDEHGDVQELKSLTNALGIGERLRFLTAPELEETPALLAEADCFLALSDNPLSPAGEAVLMALACGLPVVAADWAGLKAIVAPEVGLRVPTVWGPALSRLEAVAPLFRRDEADVLHLLAAQAVVVDVAAAWQAVARLRDEPGLRTRLAGGARSRAEDHYAWPKVIARHVQLWREAAAQAPTGPLQAAAPQSGSGDLQAAYRHYPTRWLDSEAQVVRAAPAPLPPAAGIRPYPAMLPMLSEGFLEDLLRELATPRSLGYLIERSGADADVVYGHVLWLMKQGILRGL